MLYENTKTKIRNAVEIMSRKRGYFKANEICTSFGLEKILSRAMRENGLLECRRRYGSRYIGPKPPSEAEYIAVCKTYDAILYPKNQRKTKKRKEKSEAQKTRKPAAPKQAAVQPQKNRVRLLWGLIDFTY